MPSVGLRSTRLSSTHAAHPRRTRRFRQVIEDTFHTHASGHVFTISHARLMIRTVDADRNKTLDKAEFRLLWRKVSDYGHFFMTLCRGVTHPQYGPLLAAADFKNYMRESLRRVVMAGDGSEEQREAKIASCVDLVYDSIAAERDDMTVHGFITLSEFYTVRATLELVGKHDPTGKNLTYLDLLHFAYYVRG